MPAYDYECPVHGVVTVAKSMSMASDPEYCLERCGNPDNPHGFCYEPLRRLYSGQAFIVRPSGYNLRPGDRGYGDFRRELELGEVRGGSHERRLHPIEESLTKRPEPPKIEYTVEQMREIRNFSEIMDREIRASDFPTEVREG